MAMTQQPRPRPEGGVFTEKYRTLRGPRSSAHQAPISIIALSTSSAPYSGPARSTSAPDRPVTCAKAAAKRSGGGTHNSCPSTQQMPRLHKDGATLFAEGLVHAHVRASDPCAGRIASMFIFKDAIDHKDLFTAKVPVWIEVGLRCPSHQSRSTALPHERHHTQTRHHALMPKCSCRIHHFTL